MRQQRTNEEIVDFLAAGTSPQNVLAFRRCKADRERVWNLVTRERTEGLSQNETSELERYLRLEHLMRLSRA